MGRQLESSLGRRSMGLQILRWVLAASAVLLANTAFAEENDASVLKVIASQKIERALGKNGIVAPQPHDGDICIQIFRNPKESLAAVARLDETTRDQLTRIAFEENVVLDDETPRLLVEFKNLRCLDVDCKWNPALNPILKQLKHLDTIWAQEAGLTGGDLAAIGEVATIQCLMIEDNPIPAGSFGPLAQLPQLRQCSLSNMPVSNRDVAAMFGNSPNLRNVYLQGTDVSESQVDDLRTIYPKALIVLGSKDP